ncbi:MULTISPECIES: hypothetical protein [Streptomyces]|uniref:Uncharacterized protein n=1 Tax=Streptomyces griseus subsp. griseus (strain JCM 4626 / CBS 651.72 / NBRC 13350 / KCC S-0626 / ISP 5235) TaxID=455632 RepID=B1VVS3_STRGG|nr:hypothetical protein [Streptomyces griseus]KUJ67357.1 hypothetical protein ACZ90_28885 [Streptomyces albus subsp. albus]MBW3707089.1 hypothetical protein [Streptomyces griseus]NEB50729.1 hypothetical protein [Streptomyces griseus]SEE66470.1 hypothetical protein SAMN04490359_4886 [Streptomyces griseus]SQA22954.1 Uncharacterised protein [Streptomyces griseus]
MHADVHHLLHTVVSAELHSRARAFRLPRTSLRTRVGWTLVEVGLRLTARSQEATAPRTAAAFHPA